MVIKELSWKNVTLPTLTQTVILGIFDEANNDSVVKGRRQIAFVMLSGILAIKFYPLPPPP